MHFVTDLYQPAVCSHLVEEEAVLVALVGEKGVFWEADVGAGLV